MKLNNEKNIMLCQKALYSKQLQYYSKLCKLYSELAKLKGPDVTPDEVQDTYSEALALAAKGNLDFLKPENNLVYSNNYTTQKKKLRFLRNMLFILEDLLNLKKLLPF